MKDFTEWHQLKTKIENEHRPPLFREREVWWCSIGLNIGAEEDGKNEQYERPVLVVRKFNKELLWGLPLTSIQKESPYFFPFHLHERQGSIVLSQLRLFSGKRLVRKLAIIGKVQFNSIVDAVQKLFGHQTAPLRGPRVPSGNL